MSRQRTNLASLILLATSIFLSLTFVSGHKLQKLQKGPQLPFVMYVGQRKSDESFISSQSFKKKAKEASVVFHTKNGETITRVELLDRSRDRNSGGIPVIEEGGEGFNFIKVHFKPNRGHEINFIVEMWGVKSGTSKSTGPSRSS